MRTTLDLPDDILRRAKIRAVEQRSTLRQVMFDALQREMASAESPRQRLARPPVKLHADAPLRRLDPSDVKRLDAEAVHHAETSKALALHR